MGGTALALLGVIVRETRDCGILEPCMSELVLEAAHSFARRPDPLKSKLFALCDRSTDLSDCLTLQPTTEELESAFPSLEVQDLHPGPLSMSIRPWRIWSGG
jgi:hypothetical protein